jgi:hypothetical protein
MSSIRSLVLVGLIFSRLSLERDDDAARVTPAPSALIAMLVKIYSFTFDEKGEERKGKGDRRLE